MYSSLPIVHYFSGMMFDQTGSYTLPFVVMGSVMVMGGIWNFTVVYTSEYKESRKLLQAKR